MYIKIVWSVEGRGVLSKKGEDVVPSEYVLIETNEVNYTKHKIVGVKEFDKYLVKRDVKNFTIYGKFPIWLEEWSEKRKEKIEFTSDKHMWSELIEINYDGKHIIAFKCSVFIMSNSGKTIDSLVSLA